MTRRKSPTTDPADLGRVLAALADARLASQVDRDTCQSAVVLDQGLEDPALPQSWRILADRYQAEDAQAAADAEADGIEPSTPADPTEPATDQVPGQTSILDGAE